MYSSTRHQLRSHPEPKDYLELCVKCNIQHTSVECHPPLRSPRNIKLEDPDKRKARPESENKGQNKEAAPEAKCKPAHIMNRSIWMNVVGSMFGMLLLVLLGRVLLGSEGGESQTRSAFVPSSPVSSVASTRLKCAKPMGYFRDC